MRKASILSLFFLFCALCAKAQGDDPEMADRLRSDGKIWVVVLVLATIFAGIIVALIRLDRKVRKLERERQES